MNTNYYMDLAIEQAKKGVQINEVPIGAILVDDEKNNIIAAFHNEVVKQNNPIKHVPHGLLSAPFKKSWMIKNFMSHE